MKYIRLVQKPSQDIYFHIKGSNFPPSETCSPVALNFKIIKYFFLKGLY